MPNGGHELCEICRRRPAIFCLPVIDEFGADVHWFCLACLLEEPGDELEGVATWKPKPLNLS